MAVMLIARFDGDVPETTEGYHRAHSSMMSRGGAAPSGELRPHCAITEYSLNIIGVWESDEHVRRRRSSDELRSTLTSVGFPDPGEASITTSRLHATEPPLS